MALHALDRKSAPTAHVRNICSWAVAEPVLLPAAVVKDARTLL